MSHIEIMADIETEDTAPTAVVLSIGAVAMDMEKLVVVDKFYININSLNCVELGLTQSESTLKWWASQADEAKARLYTPDPIPLKEALEQYVSWLDQHRPKGYWGNGSDFDNVILQNAFKAVGMPCWAFWKHRCHRTMKSVFPEFCAHVVREGVHHNALDDAMFQAEQLLAIMKRLREPKVVNVEVQV